LSPPNPPPPTPPPPTSPPPTSRFSPPPPLTPHGLLPAGVGAVEAHATTVRVHFVVEGALEDFGQAQREALRTELATALGCHAPLCQVDLALTAASMRVLATLTISSGAEVADDVLDDAAARATSDEVALRAASLAGMPPVAASRLLGLNVSSDIIVSVLQNASIYGITAAEDPSMADPAHSLSAGATHSTRALLLPLAAACCLLLAGVACCLSKRCVDDLIKAKGAYDLDRLNDIISTAVPRLSSDLSRAATPTSPFKGSDVDRLNDLIANVVPRPGSPGSLPSRAATHEPRKLPREPAQLPKGRPPCRHQDLPPELAEWPELAATAALDFTETRMWPELAYDHGLDGTSGGR